MTIPIELEDAAILDGANRFRIWWQIMMPLCKPTLATFFFVQRLLIRGVVMTGLKG